MGRQRTRKDRSLLEDRSTGGGTSTSERGSSTGGSSSVDVGSRPSTEGIWDAESLDSSESNEEHIESEGVVRVDRDELTDRQLEVLETAHGMGYYQYPRGANATEVAEALDICPSTLAEHLAAAQTKLLADVLEGADA